MATPVRQHDAETSRTWLDKPAVVALIAGLFTAVIAGIWQTIGQETALILQSRQIQASRDLEHERQVTERKLQLLRALPAAYQQSGHTINVCLERRLWLVQERNKPKGKQDEKRINETWQDLKKSEDDYGKIEPLEGVLTQIHALFTSKTVRRGADAMQKKWAELEKLNEESTDAWIANVTWTKSQRDSCDGSRDRIMGELNRMETCLLRDMGRELLGEVYPTAKK